MKAYIQSRPDLADHEAIRVAFKEPNRVVHDLLGYTPSYKHVAAHKLRSTEPPRKQTSQVKASAVGSSTPTQTRTSYSPGYSPDSSSNVVSNEMARGREPRDFIAELSRAPTPSKMPSSTALVTVQPSSQMEALSSLSNCQAPLSLSMTNTEG